MCTAIRCGGERVLFGRTLDLEYSLNEEIVLTPRNYPLEYRMGGGDKACPNGCIGLGTCVAACPFGAISVRDGVAAVDYHKCEGCGVCVAACPKHIIELIPFEADFWVGCKSVEPAAIVKKQCDAGCVGCKLCETVCPAGAIAVKDYVASIDYEKCTECGLCAEKCPRGIVRSSRK